jgi:hypothetical protein
MECNGLLRLRNTVFHFYMTAVHMPEDLQIQTKYIYNSDIDILMHRLFRPNSSKMKEGLWS